MVSCEISLQVNEVHFEIVSGYMLGLKKLLSGSAGQIVFMLGQ